MPPGEQVFGGTHVVVDLDGPMNQDWCEIADVIVGPRRSQIAPAPVASLVLDRYPGCEVVVGRRERDCLAGMRDGRLAAITEVGEFSDRAVSWLAIYGSFLYSWRVARMPFEGLATASVIAGRYLGSSSDRLGSLEVAGRAQIMLAHRWPRDAGGTST
ncbi:hypothetical protein [Streptosporangium subroseum]|uniref:hypothetical protein n=1 Tax=Streptosporangium subroseum TaxID=106412 RepID=UPI003086F126|nr:hypothetical protein OHB15_49330 [Streptosporangium subroseum]